MTGRWTSGVRRERLPNGLTVLLTRDTSAPVVAVVTHVKAGFFDEPDHWVGISHVLEHMFFKGTPRRGVGRIAQETKALGGYLNASTSYDGTTYFAVLPAAGLETALDIQSDALRNSMIDGVELSRELQVIIQEAKRKRDTPAALAIETLYEVMYDRHRIRRWRIGQESALAGFTRDDVCGYYRSRYVPARTILSIAGDLDEDAALALAGRFYGDWEAASPTLESAPEEPARRGVRVRTLRGDIRQAELALGWPAVPPLHPSAPALDLAAAVLSDGRGSWLYRSLRETGLVTSVGAYNFTPTELGVFNVTASLDPGRMGEALDGLAADVLRLRTQGPDSDELERARSLVLTRWVQGLETMEGRAAALAGAEALQGIEVLDREYEALSSLDVAAVRDAAAQYLTPDGVAALAYLPPGAAGDLTAAAVVNAFSASPSKRVVVAPVAAPLRPGRPVGGVADAGVWHFQLPGADLLIRPKPGVPIVTLGIYALRQSLDPPARAGLGALLVRSAIRGAGGLDGGALAAAFERLGGSVGTSIAQDWLGFRTTVQAERLAEAAALLDLVFRSPALEASEVGAELRLMIDEARQAEDDMFRFPFQLAFRAAFGDSGYGLPTGGLPETLRGITTEDVRRWHQTVVVPQRVTIVAVGEIDPQQAAEALAGSLADRPTAAAAGPLPSADWGAAGSSRVRVETRNKAQSAVAMVFPGPSRSQTERFAGDVWAAVASGLGGRLFEALRDRRSLAYTVMGSTWQKGRGGALVTYIATSPEREAEAREAMLDELERFAVEGITPDELARAVNYLAGQVEVNRQSGIQLLSDIAEAWLIGEGLRDLRDPGGQYRAVAAESVRALAVAHLRPELRAEGIVRGKSRD